MKKRVLKICLSVWENESRDKRELSLAQELGAEVMVMAKGDRTGELDRIDGFIVYRVSTRPVPFFPQFLNKLAAIFIWTYHAQKLKPDVISGHDLVALLIGYMASISMKKRNRPNLVYDSHEFEMGRNTRRSKGVTWIILHLERFLINRCAFSIMVNDAISKEVMRIHKLANKPIVARNTPDYWKLDKAEIAKFRKEFCDELGLETDAFIVMYHGGLLPNRGIETILYAVSQLEDVTAVFLGNGTESYVFELRKLIGDLKIKRRVLFKSAVPLPDLYKYIGAANIGIITIPNLYKSYYYMLPNKLFENIQALTPIIVSDFPVIKAVVYKYEVGIAVNPSNIDDIASAIYKMKNDREFYKQCKKNLEKAKEKLCWEKEKAALQRAYRMVLNEKN